LAPLDAATDATVPDDVPRRDDVRTDVLGDDARADGGVVDVPTADVGPMDAGPVDTSVVDAGLRDTGPVDAGPVDAGPVDAGSVDAGSVDAGLVDAGSVDAGLVDAGSVDAGLVDAGSVDAGLVTIRALEPIANVRLRGPSVRFRARVEPELRLPSVVVRFRDAECNAVMLMLTLRPPMYAGNVTLQPGMYCYSMEAEGAAPSPQRRFLVEATTSTFPNAVVAGFFPDYNRAGASDLLVGTVQAGQGVAVALSFDRAGNVVAGGPLPAPSNVRSARAVQGWYAGDLNDDGFGDAVVRYEANRNGANYHILLFYPGSASGLTTDAIELGAVPLQDGQYYTIHAGPLNDLDGDGVVELFLAHGEPFHAMEVRYSRAGFRSAGTRFQVGPITHAIPTPPLSGNHAAGMAWAGGPTNATTYGVMRLNGQVGTVSSLTQTGDAVTAPMAIATGFDFTGTGYSDLAFALSGRLRVFHVTAEIDAESVFASALINNIQAPVANDERFVGLVGARRQNLANASVLYATAPGFRVFTDPMTADPPGISFEPITQPLSQLGATFEGGRDNFVVSRRDSTQVSVRLHRGVVEANRSVTLTPIQTSRALDPVWAAP